MEDICTGVNAAVADVTHPVEFIVFDQLSTVSSGLDAAVLHFGNRPNHRVEVDAVTIDHFVREKSITSHLVCKIDTEGWDLKVVDGLRRCIEDRLVAMQMEFTPGLLESYTDPVERLGSLSLDYVLMEVVLERDLAETGVHRIVQSGLTSRLSWSGPKPRLSGVRMCSPCPRACRPCPSWWRGCTRIVPDTWSSVPNRRRNEPG